MKDGFRVTYAQNREDIILSGFFDMTKPGFYVDVGASHPDKFSVTKLFYEAGWRGINIEPIRSLYLLLKVRRPEDINLNQGIADKDGELTLREYVHGNGLSTLSDDIKKEYVKGANDIAKEYKDYKVPVRTLANVFKEHDVNDIQFMKVDVEGFEFEVLKSNDWAQYRPQVICVEANHVVKDWRPILKDSKYNLVFFDGLNEYYVAGEHPEVAERFSYIKAVLEHPPIPPELHNKNQKWEAEKAQLEAKLASLRLENRWQSAKIDELEFELTHSKGVRALLKALAKALDAAILNRLRRLDEPKRTKKQMLILSGTDSPRVLLGELHAYDLHQYYTTRSGERFWFKIINGAYMHTSRGLFRLALTARSALRR